MIKFFRRIRQQLLTENKFSKYLIYAIGEIILVVIGILIALQINNWNQDKIETRKEIFHLENILNNLENDLNNQITPCIQKTEKQIEAFSLLKSGFYENDNISNDSIRQLFFQNLGQWDLVLNTVAFDNLQSISMDILSNDSIKSKLLDLYGNNYSYIKSLKNNYDETHYERISTPLFVNEIDMLEGLNNEDKIKLKNDKKMYLAMKAEAYYSLGKYLDALKKTEPLIEFLIEDLTIEVKRLKDT
ncbi:DUF6090 family protein [Muriicola sp. Z0-33]|uniref:DUF6090 family protein n=1 Tax=Muriicola sp. Z0-33 TaxID=2816957 RepID=UPI002237D531|nr:DUF6090 family protein [Muriicola sp. Z0-33]MCW5518175.1 hypothetical protein [Muriicola sp. Z0-33]